MRTVCLMTGYQAILVQGDKALDFLQGQLSNSVLDLCQKMEIKSLFCSTKGRILACLSVVYHHEQIYLILPSLLWPKLESILIKVAQLSRVQLIPQPNMTIYKDLEHSYLEASADFILESYDDWKKMQFDHLQFEIYPETAGLFLAHDLGLEKRDWIDFNKGCFRGQEIIARMHYLSESKYTLVHIDSNAQNTYRVGDVIYQENSQDFLAQVVDKHPSDFSLLCLIKKNQPLEAIYAMLKKS